MDHFIATYQQLDGSNLASLATIYSPDIHFIDPVHEIHGLAPLTAYFAGLYREIRAIEFSCSHQLQLGLEGYLQWQLSFSHSRLARGRPVLVQGASYLRFQSGGKVELHRDYFDLGAMLYEQLPLLGRVITTIKGRLAR
ncbi:nuclear transport factor 2 family protein [Desulfogranum mediterraneum]|uniref:nuclear transport factor 2 family protein n=1 Tax=Desulfogranum mediterraneum TaxID=160661 RepID=UPI000401EC31|nr:nuclear transport factor 2 family protein [Desulfogranum mediterraneum]